MVVSVVLVSQITDWIQLDGAEIGEKKEPARTLALLIGFLPTTITTLLLKSLLRRILQIQYRIETFEFQLRTAGIQIIRVVLQQM